MRAVERRTASTAPIAVGDRTITLRSCTTTVRVPVGRTTIVMVHARPDHVEALDGDGRRTTRRVHDWVFTIRMLAAAAVAGAVMARRRRQR
jgi:hypothetical protein